MVDETLVINKHKALEQIVAQATQKPFPVDLPVIVHNSRDEIIDYLGYRHITGVKPWDSLAKARYLRQLYDRSSINDIDERCRELAKAIGSGSRSDYVRKLLCALNIYDTIEGKDYFKVKGLNEESISFSLITTALGYPNLRSFIGIDTGQEIDPNSLMIDHLKELTEWMFDRREGKTRLGESRNLGQLANVVSNSIALKEFRNGEPLETAYYLTEGARESVINSIREAFNYLEIAYRYAKDITLEEDDHALLDKIIKTANAIKKQTRAE